MLNENILSHAQALTEVLCRSRTNMHFSLSNRNSLDIKFTQNMKEVKRVVITLYRFEPTLKVSFEMKPEEFKRMTYSQIENLIKQYLG